MIKSFRHKGLADFFYHDQRKGVPPAQVKRLRLILTVLESAMRKEHLNAPGLALHSLKGDRSGYLAVKVTGNWRVTFRFEDTDVYDVDLEDYH